MYYGLLVRRFPSDPISQLHKQPNWTASYNGPGVWHDSRAEVAAVGERLVSQGYAAATVIEAVEGWVQSSPIHREYR